MQSDNYIYRGVRSSKYSLVPSIGRIRNRNGKKISKKEEELILKIFKHRGYPFLKDYKDDKLELLSIGQHYGLPTRLLDWTKNLMTAIFFAVEKPYVLNKNQKDYSCIYIYHPTNKVKLDNSFDPFNINEVKRFIPKHWIIGL